MYQPNKKFLAALVLLAVGLKILPYQRLWAAHYEQVDVAWSAGQLWQLLGLELIQGYPWGITLLPALAIFGMALFSNLRLAAGTILLASFLSDLAIGTISATQYGLTEGFRFAIYPGFAFSYLSLLIICGFGLLVRQRRNWLTILAAAVGGPTLFYLVTNAATWYFDSTIGYSRDWNGLMQAYVAGLPFYRNALISTVGFSGLLFSPLGLAQMKRVEASATVAASPVVG
ncbi:DUF6580 family putative transport protein [Planctomicrobium sp. SH664]|uniref:DUF6580 family putative transport protein n=1 Tax=Planctomicrobium sp. SH664 TaxID=3448125 RepID=UPI003F5C8340